MEGKAKLGRSGKRWAHLQGIGIDRCGLGHIVLRGKLVVLLRREVIVGTRVATRGGGQNYNRLEGSQRAGGEARYAHIVHHQPISGGDRHRRVSEGVHRHGGLKRRACGLIDIQPARPRRCLRMSLTFLQ